MTNSNSSNVFNEFRELLNTADLADLGSRRRPAALPLKKLYDQIDALLGHTALPKRAQDLMRGTLLLWHDHLDESHEIAQNIEDADGSLLHAIMHRREPDYWNSKYWFRRVGQHPCYPMIATRVLALLGSEHKELASRIVPAGSWDPFAFVDVCEEAAGRATEDSRKALLQRVQKIEFETLLEHLLQIKSSKL